MPSDLTCTMPLLFTDSTVPLMLCSPISCPLEVLDADMLPVCCEVPVSVADCFGYSCRLPWWVRAPDCGCCRPLSCASVLLCASASGAAHASAPPTSNDMMECVRFMLSSLNAPWATGPMAPSSTNPPGTAVKEKTNSVQPV